MPIVWRSIMSKKTKKSEWFKTCRDCGKIQYYSNEAKLKRAMKCNTRCKSCNCKSDEHRKANSEGLTGKSRPKWVIDKIRNSRTYEPISNETREKLRLSHLGQIHSDETRKKLSDSLKGITRSNETRKKMRLAALDRLKKNVFKDNPMHPNYNPSSISIIEEKARELGITDLKHAENGGEYYIKELGYWVDGFSKEKNIVIEYYEPHHKRQVEKDQIRQKEITEYLGCEFIVIEQ